MSTRPTLRVRKSGAVLIAAGIAIVGSVPLAGASRALAPIILIPIVVFLWAWRAGTDVYADQVKVRGLVGGSRVPWNRIVELAPDQRGRVSALLDNGNVIRLTGVTRDNLPMVLAAGGQPVAAERPTAPAPAPSDPAEAAPASSAPASSAPAAAAPAASAASSPSASDPAEAAPGEAAAGEALPAENRAVEERPADERPATDH